MGEIVSEDHVVQELVRSVEDIPIGVADVLTVLQQLCSEHDPKAMSAVLLHAQTYAQDHLPRLRRLVRLSMRPFEAACHYPLANFPAVMQGTITATPAATRPAPSLFYLNMRSPFYRSIRSHFRMRTSSSAPLTFLSLTPHSNPPHSLSNFHPLTVSLSRSLEVNGPSQYPPWISFPCTTLRPTSPVPITAVPPPPPLFPDVAASFPKVEKEVVVIRAAHRRIDDLVTGKHVILQPRTVQQQDEQEEQEQEEQEQEQQQQAHGDLGWQQEQIEGAFLLANGDGLQQTNGDVKWQANGDVKWQVDEYVQKEALPLIQTASPLLLSFLGHLGHLASTVVKASDNYLHLNKQLAHMFQPSPALNSAAAPSSLQEKFQSLHSALACRQERVDAAWKQLCALQGQVERELVPMAPPGDPYEASGGDGDPSSSTRPRTGLDFLRGHVTEAAPNPLPETYVDSEGWHYPVRKVPPQSPSRQQEQDNDDDADTVVRDHVVTTEIVTEAPESSNSVALKRPRYMQTTIGFGTGTPLVDITLVHQVVDRTISCIRLRYVEYDNGFGGGVSNLLSPFIARMANGKRKIKVDGVDSEGEPTSHEIVLSEEPIKGHKFGGTMADCIKLCKAFALEVATNLHTRMYSLKDMEGSKLYKVETWPEATDKRERRVVQWLDSNARVFLNRLPGVLMRAWQKTPVQVLFACAKSVD
ncbi:unnamed protein product [Closterium sp. NIES-64]|nr:unnamed protein product [Closterium sp. NIES-64]